MKEIYKKTIIINVVLAILVTFLLLIDFMKEKQNLELKQSNKKLDESIELAKQSKQIVELFEEKEKKQIEEKEELVEQILPIDSSDVLEVIKKLSGIAKDLNITEIDFSFKKSVVVSTEKKSSRGNGSETGMEGGMDYSSQPEMERSLGGSKADVSKKGLSLYKYPIELEFQGTYRQIGEFIVQIRKIKRLLTVEKLTIKRSSNAHSNLLSASLVINTYAFLSQQ